MNLYQKSRQNVLLNYYYFQRRIYVCGVTLVLSEDNFPFSLFALLTRKLLCNQMQKTCRKLSALWTVSYFVHCTAWQRIFCRISRSSSLKVPRLQGSNMLVQFHQLHLRTFHKPFRMKDNTRTNDEKNLYLIIPQRQRFQYLVIGRNIAVYKRRIRYSSSFFVFLFKYYFFFYRIKFFELM